MLKDPNSPLRIAIKLKNPTWSSNSPTVPVECFLVRNSWGAMWGEKGYFKLPLWPFNLISQFNWAVNPDGLSYLQSKYSKSLCPTNSTQNTSRFSVVDPVGPGGKTSRPQNTLGNGFILFSVQTNRNNTHISTQQVMATQSKSNCPLPCHSTNCPTNIEIEKNKLLGSNGNGPNKKKGSGGGGEPKKKTNLLGLWIFLGCLGGIILIVGLYFLVRGINKRKKRSQMIYSPDLHYSPNLNKSILNKSILNQPTEYAIKFFV